MKYRFKWNPCLDYEMAAQERWLEELSREGLSVRHLFGPLALCDQGEPHPARRFRIEPARTWASASDPPARELTDLYQEAGWTYLRRLPNELGELFYTDDPGAPEPYPDPETKALALEGLRRHFWGRLWKNLALFLLSGLYLFVFLPKLSPGVSASLSAPLLCLYLVFLALELLLDGAEWRGMRRTCRRLEEGETAPLPPAPRLGALKGAVTLAGFLLLILTLALIIAVLPLLILEVPL